MDERTNDTNCGRDNKDDNAPGVTSATVVAAARAIKEADVLLLVTGAGFSADSGLAVYNDLGKVDAYKRRGLDYADVCQPKWIDRDPELFYGFWGQCFNDYRSTPPHDGYQILRRWRDEKNKRAPTDDIPETSADELRTLIYSKNKTNHDFFEDDETKLKTPYIVDHNDKSSCAGAFYAFTSNADGHHYDVFDAHEIHDCHGNIELWQCSDRDCESGIWRAPSCPAHKFVVDKATMLAPEFADRTDDSNNEPQKGEEDGDRDDEGPARVGHVKNSGRRRMNLLQNMPPGTDRVGWSTSTMGSRDTTTEIGNWPRCGHCRSLARPAIFMFGDFGWKYDMSQYNRWEIWREAVLDLAEDKQRKSEHSKQHDDESATLSDNNEAGRLKVCILEIGCGMNVSNCRVVSEEMVEELVAKGGKPTLVRINPDFPDAPEESISAKYTIPVRCKGLEAIQQIEKVYNWKT